MYLTTEVVMQVVLFCLSDDEASLQMIVKEGLRYAQRPCILVDMSTVKQSTTLKYGFLRIHILFVDEQSKPCSFDSVLQL